MSREPSRLPELVANAAARDAARDAVVMDGTRLSYEGLEEASNRLARSLRAHGVRRGDRVAMWLPKSPEAIVALHGIMKAGAAYVPVDPGAPPARLAWIARNCGVAGLVSRTDRAAALDEAFAGVAPMRAVWFADEGDDAPRVAGLPGVPWSALASESGQPVDADLSPSDLAYVLYTSGSTGEPKGVMLSHANALAFVSWAATTFGIRADDRLANHAPFHFDLSTFDLFAAPWAGASVHPVPARIFSFPAAVAKAWTEERLTVWYATPSTLVLLLTRGGLAQRDLSAVRVLLFAGEVFPVKYLRQLMALAPKARFANLYGPTETNVCTWFDVGGAPADDTPLPIGVPCCGDRALVLDESRKPVPEGTEGELWIHGPTVMQGYWGDPERTARALERVELGPGVAGVAYRTGDLVRKRADGNLEFLGRRDHQVKTRGYRVELGEIESALHRHPDVDEAVVIATPDEELTNRLNAVVVRRAQATADEAALQQHCAQTLPRYMVPERIALLPSLPRTSSGKVDRRALADVFSAADAGGIARPRSPETRA